MELALHTGHVDRFPFKQHEPQVASVRMAFALQAHGDAALAGCAGLLFNLKGPFRVNMDSRCQRHFYFGAICLDVRTEQLFAKLMGFPLNH